MTTTAAARPQLEKLSCPACGGPVPLADADATPCPYCATSVPVPENLRRLRRELLALVGERRAAERLYGRLGKPPPKILRVFAFFESAWFWMFALGFWLTAGIALFTFAVPSVAAHIFHINTWDVLTDQQQSMISIGGTLGSVVLGLLLAGWNRKRVVSLGALQAALAASPPHSAGGPARCRHCGGALVLAPGALGARCDYCRADNLVAIPADWVARAGRIVRKVAQEENAAIVADAQARASLRWSLFWRLLLGGGFTALVMGMIGAGEPRRVDRDSVDLYGDASFLPTWTRDQIPSWTCDLDHLGFPMVLDHCARPPCEGAYLVALAAGKPYQVHLRGGSESTEVTLDARHMRTLDATWDTVARGTVSEGQVTLVPPSTGWYRMRIRGGETPSRVNWCGHQG